MVKKCFFANVFDTLTIIVWNANATIRQFNSNVKEIKTCPYIKCELF